MRTSSVICASALLSLVLAVPAASASTYESFSSVIEVRPDASFVVTETIAGEFAVERHGIYRSVPVLYHGENGVKQTIGVTVLGVTRDGNAEPHETYPEGDYQMIKIGAADVTFAGPFSYEITYRVERAMLFHETADELYWNVTGDQWDEPIGSVTAIVRVPGARQDQLSVACYTGSAGSAERNCAWQTVNGTVYAQANDFLTVAVAFPKGIVAEPTGTAKLGRWLSDNWPFLFLFVPLFTAAWAVRHWYRHGRDPKGRGTLVVEYDAPKGLAPTETGTLIDARLHDKDFSAGIVDLAVRGYARIVEEEGKTFSLHRLRKDTDGLKSFEAELLTTLFADDDAVNTKDHKDRFVAARKRVDALVYESMAADGYYAKNPEKVRAGYVAAATIAAFACFLTGWFAIVLGPVAAILFVLAHAMPKRTDKGQAAFDHARGFQEYLSRAEKYRIEWQEKEGIFEKFLPYAMAFGVADKWSKALAVQQTTAPGWYVGPMLFDAGDFGDRMGSLGAALGAVSAPKSSGGSGGGGFSGGGFGGGGGGSW